MRLTHPISILAVLLMAALAGCISDDDDVGPKDDEDPDANPTEETGSIEGETITADLETVKGASVALIDADGGLAASTQSSEKGSFVINGVEPGKYRIQVAAICCKASAQHVEVTANEVTKVSFQLDGLTNRDLQSPEVVEKEWDGFIACGVGSAAISWATCSTLEDPNDDFLHKFEVAPGLQSIVVGVSWTATGGVMGTDLWALVEKDGCGLDCENSETYGQSSGEPDLIVRITKGPSSDLSFENIEDNRTIQMRVFPSGEANVIYQQPFKVYWHEFYWHDAPQDFNPFPDD